MSDGKVFKHQDFAVEETARKKIIRQDRMYLNSSKCKLLIDGLTYEVFNITAFGTAIIANEIQLRSIQKKNEKEARIEATLIYESYEVQKIYLRYVRDEIHPTAAHNERIVGFEVLGEIIKIDRIKALEAVSEKIESHKNKIMQAESIPSAFKSLVYEFKDWLAQLKKEITDVEETMSFNSLSESEEYTYAITSYVSDYLASVFPLKYKNIPSFLDKINSDEKKVAMNFAREQIASYIYGAPFANRAFYKPRGYAGDYEMMNHLYRDEHVGKTLFDKCMHRYLIEEPAAKAVKNRGKYLLNKLTNFINNSTEKEINIVSIACGPTFEIQNLIKHNKFPNKKINITLIDQDEESLKYAQREILAIDRFAKSGINFEFSNLAIKNIIIRGLKNNGYNLIYSAGLFDYFSDPVAQAAANKLYESLCKEGQLIIGNFSKNNPTQPLMEVFLDWHLIYRSEEELTKLFGVICNDIKIEKEELGVNLFAILKK